MTAIRAVVRALVRRRCPLCYERTRHLVAHWYVQHGDEMGPA